jgi:hypothetical protein
LRTPVAALREFDGENLDAAPAAAAELARLLQGLAAGADQLAELLAMRHFTHSERDLRTVAT